MIKHPLPTLSVLFSYKENLVLKRLISIKLGSKSVTIHDVVENQGYEEQPVMLLYPFNIGYPLLDEGSRVVLPNTEEFEILVKSF